jgi:hypothetical protein
MRLPAVEFLVHMSLAAAVAAVNVLTEEVRDGLVGRDLHHDSSGSVTRSVGSRSEHIPHSASMLRPMRVTQRLSVTGARLDLQWRQLRNVEYLTDGGNSWIHTAVLDGRPVVVKTLKPECQDVAIAINEIESELGKSLLRSSFSASYSARCSAPFYVLPVNSRSRKTQPPKHCQPGWSWNDNERNPVRGLGTSRWWNNDANDGVRYSDTRSEKTILAEEAIFIHGRSQMR